jgi:16S rRNA (guanine527-N7)-methyltransferase
MELEQLAEDFYDKLLLEKGIVLSTVQQEHFRLYYQELVSWNEKMNLTGITERNAVYLKHFYDSLSLSFHLDFTSIQNLADIGSGAGFPSLPLKILFPQLQVTIVDSLNKRILFLRHIADLLQLENVQCIHGRAEDIARLREHRDQYDVVTARAVARLAVLNEFCLPFVKVGGTFAAMKGANPGEELKESGKSLRELRGEVSQVVSSPLPVEVAERHVILIKKRAATPAIYPRKAGFPLRSPLV